MVKVRIKCPDCDGVGHIEVDKTLILENSRGITAINVAENLICEHSFVAYIDTHFKMRDSFIADFKVQLPEIKIDVASKVKVSQDSKSIDLYLISLNLPALSLSYILRACFNGRKILLINDLEVMIDHLKNFFNYIFEESFNFDISIEKIKHYKENKKKFKEYIIINKDRIVSDKEKLLNIKSMKVENAIIQKFLAEYDPEVSLIILKNEIQKSFKLASELISLNQNLDENEELSSKSVIDHFNKLYGVKIGKYYIDFLTEIAINYFKENFRQAKGASDLFGYF